MNKNKTCVKCGKLIYFKKIGNKYKAKDQNGRDHLCKYKVKINGKIIEFESKVKSNKHAEKRHNNKNKRFYDSKKWSTIRKKVFLIYDRKCMACGSTKELQVDHIKPRSKFPELELDIYNLQILCKKCNFEKFNYNSIDYRTNEDISCLVDFLGKEKIYKLYKKTN